MSDAAYLRPDRRTFLTLSAATAGALVLSGRAHAQAKPAPTSPFGVWLRIENTGAVTVFLSQSEMGQGISTTLPLVLSEELGADWPAVRTEWSPFDPAYRHPQYQWMFTGNSESTSTFYPIMRQMGAAAREMLCTAAAERLKVPPADLTCAGGRITHAASGRSLGFGDVAAAAAARPVPTNPKSRPDGELTRLGRPQPRWDLPGKVDGSAIFGLDVKVPGMAVAAIRRAPSPGGKLVAYDRAAILKRKGVVGVVEIASGLAVVADRYWAARQALAAGRLVFAEGSLAGYSTEAQRADHHKRLAGGPFAVRKTAGAGAKTLEGGEIIAAVYESPAQAHATMEPMNCTAHVTADRCELWAPTQGMEVTQAVCREATGLRDDQIVIHRTLLGGGFGRRLLADFARIAIEVSQGVQRPVKVIWSREEDFTYDAFRPPMTHEIRARLGPDGQPAAMAHRVVSPSHMLYIFPRTVLQSAHPWDRPIAPPPDYDGMAVEGLVETPYEIADYSVALNTVETPLSTSVWRTTGHGPNNFALESFVDELAHAAGQDPLAYRLTLAAKDPRAIAVLKAVAEMSGWPIPRKETGVARGLALGKAFGGYIAQVVEVSMDGDRVRARRVWSAVDCGRILDPGISTSNIQGGVVWGLSALRTEVGFQKGRPLQTNFDGFDPLHMWETPQIETRLMASNASPTGIGEIGPVVTPAAFCNAVFAATGRRVRSLPLSRSGVQLA